MRAAELAAIKRQLEEELKDLLKEPSPELDMDTDERVGYSNHMGENANEIFEQTRNLTLLQDREREIEEIKAALRRIEEGSYGRCESCGKMIDQERLRALPEVRLCLACQQRLEENL